MLAHSTLLTIATEVAPKARGMAMSLVAFAFMGGGGIGAAIGGHPIRTGSFSLFYGTCSLALAVLALIVVRDVRTELERLVSTRAQ